MYVDVYSLFLDGDDFSSLSTPLVFAIFVPLLLGNESLWVEQAAFCPSASFLMAGRSTSFLCEKAAIKQTQQEKFRSQEFHSLPNEKGCWAVVAACRERDCGEGCQRLLCRAGYQWKQTCCLTTCQCFKDRAPQTCPRETGLYKMHEAPRWEVVTRQQNLVSTLFTIHTTVSRQSCPISL